MADTLTFGPQWLRALSDGGNKGAGNGTDGGGGGLASPPQSPDVQLTVCPIPKYKLAEHRYGREEMLALYIPSNHISAELREHPTICIEKPQQPLALVPLSEDEQRLMSQSVNSTAVLRRGGSGPSTRGTGRGGSVDRGRGRGRGRGDGYYQRGSFEEDGFGRGRARGEAWDDGRDKRECPFPSSRGYTEEDQVSPRTFSRSMSSENWREARKTEEEDEGGDWRRAGNKDRWGSRGSWRGERGFERDYHDRGRFEDSRGAGPPNLNRNRSRSGGWDQEGEFDLPEWSMPGDDMDMDMLGTFDSSGAFMSLKELEDRFEKDREGHTKEKPLQRKSESDKADPQPSGDSPRSDDIQVNENCSPETQDIDNRQSHSPSSQQRIIKKDDQEPSSVAADTGNGQSRLRQDSKSAGFSSRAGAPASHSVNKSGSKPNTHIVNNRGGNKNVPSQTANSTSVTVNAQSSENANLPAQSGLSEASHSGASRGGEGQKEAHTAGASETVSHADPAISASAENTNNRSEDDADFDHLHEAAENLVATISDEKESPTAASGEEGQAWYYRDPQGDLQGPFQATEMAEWFLAGYFTMTLLVRRGTNGKFQPLGDLIKRYGRYPFKSDTEPSPPKTSPTISAPVPATAVPTTPAEQPAAQVTAPLPQTSQAAQDPLKILHQQLLIQQQFIQQQQLYKQLQLQQIMQALQQQEGFSKLTTQQQQQHALQLMLKQQAGLLQQQLRQPVATIPTAMVPGMALPQQTPVELAALQQQAKHQQQQQQQRLSPRSQESLSPAPSAFQRTISQQPAAAAPGQPPVFQRSLSQPATDAPPSTSATGWVPSGSVWDINPVDSQTLEELHKREAMMQDEKEKGETEKSRQAAEIEERRKLAQEELGRQHELQRQRDVELQRETDRKRELDRQEMERQRQREEEQREIERKRIEQVMREEGERRKLEEEEQRRREDEERRRWEQEERRKMEEEERRKREEERLQLEEEKRKKEVEEMERKRQDEIRRRQEKEEQRRLQQQQQQIEALRRIQQEQMANIQLPAAAQWGASGGSQSSAPSLSQIQQLEAENDRIEQADRQRQLEIQRQQLAALQQQQQQQSRSWTAAASNRGKSNSSSNATAGQGTPSLLEIQQEQARQLLENASRQQQQQQLQQQQQQSQQPAPSIPLVSATVWGNNPSTSSTWATDGGWGTSNVTPTTAQSQGFWDDAIKSASVIPTNNNKNKKKSSNNNNAHFPSLSSSQPILTNNSIPSGGKQTGGRRAKKEEETVQRLFQSMQPVDDFTQWCQSALKGMQTSVDIPTFVAFLMDVESPYEVHDYVRSYLGEGKDSATFAKMFLEKRCQYHGQRHQRSHEDELYTTARGNNPTPRGNTSSASTNNISYNIADSEESKLSKKKKKQKMQKLDSSILGFTVHAAPDRLVGEIESLDA